MHPAAHRGPGDSTALPVVVRRRGRRSYDDGIDSGPGGGTTLPVIVRRFGRRSYVDGCALQERAARAVAGGGPDELLYLEHPPVITLGRGGGAEQMLAGPAELAAAGIAVARTDRGGGVTYHGPGQLVGYPIIDLRRRGLGVRSYLRALEGALVATLHDAGIDAGTRAGLTGVWTARGKIAAIGVAVRRGITRHGFALNVAVDLHAFRHIVPCGLREPVTSLAEHGWTGEAPWLQGRAAGALREALRHAAGCPRAIPPAARPARPVRPTAMPRAVAGLPA